MNIILSFSHAFISKTPFPVMLIVLCIGFVPYMLAVQIIETSRYNHQDEIDISKVQPNDKNDSPSKEWKKLSPLRKVETVIGGFFLFLPFFYALFPGTFQAIFLNRYTTAFLPESAIQVMKEFFNLNVGAGFCLLLLAGIVMIRIITIPLRLIFRITSKISPERNTREL